MQKISDYVGHAAECRKMAAHMKDPQHKKQLEEMAETWTMLARESEKRLKRQGESSLSP